MYCRNCGKQVLSEGEICKECGFYSNNGNKFCPTCGKEVLPEQAMCLNCKTLLIQKAPTPVCEKEEAPRQSKEKVYLKYLPRVKNINLLFLFVQIITILLVFSMVFIPIYKYKYEPELTDIENYEQFLEATETGYLEGSFSLFDDLKIIISKITSSLDSESDELESMSYFMTGAFAVFEVIIGIVLLFSSISSMTKTVSRIQQNEDSTMLMYNEMLKTGGNKKKENIFKKQTAMGMVIFAIFDVIFSKIYGELLASIGVYSARHMINFSGVSVSIAIIVVLLISYITLNSMRKKETEKMLLEITRAEFDSK